MLTRAAHRRKALHYVQHAAERIQLPWLCPALTQPRHLSRSQRSIASRPSLPSIAAAKSLPSPAPVTHSRHLATPATVSDDFDPSDDYIPFAYARPDHTVSRPPQSPSPSQPQPKPLGEAASFDLSQLLMLETTIKPDDQQDAVRLPPSHSERNVHEIEATLDACLQVRRWDRARTLLSHLALFYQPNSPILRASFNRVFGTMVDDFLRNRNAEHETHINRWIEVHMKKARLEPDAHVLALRLKVALASMLGWQRERTVRRYWEMTQQYRLESQVLSLRDVLDDRDLGQLSQICPFELRPTHGPEWPTGTGRPLETPPLTGSEDAPVRETEQKGLGLSTLKGLLSTFAEPSGPTLGVVRAEDPAVARQRKLERESIRSALDRWRIEHAKRAKQGITGDLAHGKIGALLWQWHEILADKIATEIKLVNSATSTSKAKLTPHASRMECAPFLELMPPANLAAVVSIAMMQIMSKLGAAKQVRLSRLVTEVGKIIESEYDALRVSQKKSARMNPAMVPEELSAPPSSIPEVESAANPHLLRRSSHHAASPYSYRKNWSTAIHAKLGALLCELMFDTAKITVTRKDEVTGRTISLAQPVFIHSTTYVNGKRVGVVSLHEDFVKILVSEPAEHLVAKQLPMVCPPKPWKNFYDGGFLESTQPFLRVKFNETAQKDYGIAAAERGDLDQLFAGVDVLGQTGWRINKQVFLVMLEAWNSGKQIANLPPLNKSFPEIQRPAAGATPKERWEWYSQMRAMENERSGLHSNRCFQNFQMEIAKSFLDETFYLPHNVDFRGRAYPIPPYLNQMGADNARGLLLFEQGRELGLDGLRWLKIHLANVCGYDKASLADRAQFATDHLDDIHDSVTNPLTGKRWWLEAEDPWQCLATCFELTNALALPDPSKFVSRLPIHQDGSCNGLQHYAALGGDKAGARQVNLEPGDKPADVYTGVCELVKQEVRDDAARGDPLAKLLDGKLTRKVVKQTVMTNVYGVTFLGAVRQVRKQIDVLIPEIEAARLSGKASVYIARKIFKGLGALFTGAHEIQYWLGDCANRISASISPAQLEKMFQKEFGRLPATPDRLRRRKTKAKDLLESAKFRSTVIWTTPLKLPVVQPYRVSKGVSIQTNLQNISLAQPSVADSINKRKQLQAFPPNFIHSLDATHMVLSALKANELGLTFSAVHDSFWTHASDVNQLSELLRDAFIRMHSEDIIGRLAAEFRMRYSGHYYLAQIKRHNPLGKAILAYRKQILASGSVKSGRGHSRIQERKHAELLREIQKQKLMQSPDPEERAEGESMETAASLFEKFQGEKYLLHRDSLGATAIGAVPENTHLETVERAISGNDAAHDVDLASTLDPLRESVADEEDDVVSLDELEPTENVGTNSATSSKTAPLTTAFGHKLRKTTSRGSAANQIWLWLPLTFPPVPQKGDFDVKRLKDSTYFFS